MTEKYVNICVNLDVRDAEGKPTVIKTPKETVPFNHDDIIHFSISVLENGVETVLREHAIWNSNIWDDPDTVKGSLVFKRKEQRSKP